MGIDTEEYVRVGLMVLLLICAANCGSQPDYTTRHGIDVYEQNATADQTDIEEITRVALELWSTDTEGLVLRLRPDPIRYIGDPHVYHGTFAEGTMTVWVYQHPCFARGTFGHELLHAISWLETGDADRKHKTVGPLDKELRKRTIAEICL